MVRVFGERRFLAHPAPVRGQLTIGRVDTCDIVVVENSVSRLHATLHFGAEGTAQAPVTIEDAGSSNGTRVGGVRLTAGQRCPLLPGQLVELGAVLLTIDPPRTAQRALRRVWPHGQFEARIEDRCESCSRSDAGFAVARISVEHGGAARALAGAVPEPMTEAVTSAASGPAIDAAIDAAIAGVLYETDVLGSYAPGQYEILLAERSGDEFAAWRAQVAARFAPVARVRVAIARFPEHGRSAAALQAHLSSELAAGAEALDVRGEIVVLDDAMRGLHRLIERVAGVTDPVLLTGETGAGKEVLADSLHRHSPRRDRLFVRVNCAALAEPIAEGVLFGHERGALTGAAPGLLEAADGGTVFLDEVGELPLVLQAKLLRLIDERQVRPVGAVQPRAIDVRFVAATTRRLEDEVAAGRFGQELYFRLSGVTLAVPPLRQRPAEIVALAGAFLQRAAAAIGVPPPPLSEAAKAALLAHAWPGNVRELKNAADRAVLVAPGDEIGPAELGLDAIHVIAVAPDSSAVGPPRIDGHPTDRDPAPERPGSLPDQIAVLERKRILDALERCGGNRARAARELGISRGTLIARLERYGAPRPRRPGTGD